MLSPATLAELTGNPSFMEGECATWLAKVRGVGCQGGDVGLDSGTEDVSCVHMGDQADRHSKFVEGASTRRAGAGELLQTNKLEGTSLGSLGALRKHQR